jgi:histone deacetylase complex regulatory component SIN3
MRKIKITFFWKSTNENKILPTICKAEKLKSFEKGLTLNSRKIYWRALQKIYESGYSQATLTKMEGRVIISILLWCC